MRDVYFTPQGLASPPARFGVPLDLSRILPLLQTVPALRSPAAGGGAPTIVLEEAKAAVIAALATDRGKPVLLVTARQAKASSFADQLQAWLGPSSSVLGYPEPDVLPFEQMDPDGRIVGQRVRTLHALAASVVQAGPTVIVAPVHGLGTRTVSPDQFRSATRELAGGNRPDWERTVFEWLRLGYRRVETVRQPGEMARRGGIVDIFPPHLEEPVRMELWGDEIDNIRLFDPTTQRSSRLVQSFAAPPARELVPDRASLPKGYGRQAVGGRRKADGGMGEPAAFHAAIERLFAGEDVPSYWYLAPLFNRASLAAYLPPGSLIVLDEPQELEHGLDELRDQAEQARGELDEKGELPAGFPDPILTWRELNRELRKAGSLLELRRWGGEGDEALGFHPLPGYAGRLREALNDIRRAAQARERVVVVSHQSQRLAELLSEDGLTLRPVDELTELPQPGSVSLVHGALPGGWRLDLPDAAQDGLTGPPDGPPVILREQGLGARAGRGPKNLEGGPGAVSVGGGPPAGPGNLAGWRSGGAAAKHRPGEALAQQVAAGPLRIITDAELFGFVKEGRRRASRRAAFREHPLQGLAPGDYVVHVEHGIAQFVQTVTMEEQPGARKEYLLLAYANGGRLYVPSDQVDRVARYVGHGANEPGLSTLGTQEWERAKARVKAAAQHVAKELLDTSAARQIGPGTGFAPDTVWQREMEASFPYIETPDQLQAVHDMKRDMERPRPMDRLVCGDVGYGKTEVAVRGAFKAVQEGAQVAVLVPTTVLTQQHYQTFSQRLGAFPVKVAALSRFQSDREQQQILAGLRAGELDIVIGTHRLVQKDVEFRNLGLLIVDEEQRFGVMHKEYFKRLRRSIDVLTLSATPIPRTLYMALAGVRDMSVMETPPEERLPIKTYVMEFDEGSIRQAVLREIERGGQVFFVHNRVQTMGEMVYRLRKLVPEASFGAAHGQMPEEYLERAMLDFTEGEYDVLVCSTIIESGLDLPNVNTIIINDADKLGLAQLYQLRGRVGRGSSRAYAYLLFTRNKALTERAAKRLQAVFEATDLGAGYFIAQKDLEIRGAGNLLGTEQSGQIGAVGFDLYCRILAGAVEDAKAEQAGLPLPSQVPQPPAVTIGLGLAAHLPDDYVPDLDTRLELYRRLAAVTLIDSPPPAPDSPLVTPDSPPVTSDSPPVILSGAKNLEGGRGGAVGGAKNLEGGRGGAVGGAKNLEGGTGRAVSGAEHHEGPEVLEEIAQELHDRFGPLPQAAEQLLFGVRVKLLATRAGVESVMRRDGEIVVQLLTGLHVDAARLRGLAGVHAGNTQMRVAAAGNPDRWGPVLEEALGRLGP